MLSWLYVSRSRPTAEGVTTALEMIAGQSRGRNAALDVTGGLIFTGTHFAQRIEGPVDSIRQLQASIRADPRHYDVLTLRESPITTRCFKRWALATAFNASHFVEQIIGRAVDGVETRHQASIDALSRLLIEFSRET